MDAMLWYVVPLLFQAMESNNKINGVMDRDMLKHPGGDELILEYAGRDATRAFNDAGHSVDAIQDMKLYKKGIVDNQCSQKHVTSEISITPDQKMYGDSKADQEYCRKEKKRLKLFFCF